MNNFDTILSKIKDAATANKECYFDLLQYLKEHKSKLSIDNYLATMQDLGLLQFYADSKLIILTELGKCTGPLFELESAQYLLSSGILMGHL